MSFTPGRVSKPLFKSIRIPRKIIIDHQVCLLQVHPFPGSVRGNQNQNIRIITEILLYLFSLIIPGLRPTLVAVQPSQIALQLI